ncbi:Hint domain-containing protein [Paracoccus sp. (in: a-proteobacteria)]|uniref:Hint domain-containing protein n=1 Tax=Paracoccus sp. TaxID=267 RepID=UPI0035B433E4
MPSRTAVGSSFYLGQTSYNGTGAVGTVFDVNNAETSTIAMVSDPSSTGHGTYGGWNNNGVYGENYAGDDNNLDMGEAIRLDIDGDGSLDNDPWLRVTDFDRYQVAVTMVDGSVVNGVGVILSGIDPATQNVYQTLVFGDQIVGNLNATEMNITRITLGTPITVGGGGMDLTQVFQMNNFANELADYTIVPCFARGTMILTARGECAVEDLVIGDRVTTADHGDQEIRWIGSREVAAQDNFAPVCVKKGALGNDRDLWLSPQHRVLVSGDKARLLFDKDEVLVAVKALVNDRDILVKPGGMVEYFHILLDLHEVVFANGTAAESLYLGEQALRGFSRAARDEITSLFPELEQGEIPDGARPFLTVRQGREWASAARPA